MRCKAPAKINLFLKITGQRADGYHELQTLMQKLTLHDQLELTLEQEQGVRLSCPNSDLPVNEGNIVYRAAELFFTETGRDNQGVSIVLKKNIPVAAGLGGGSSDAAAILLGLNRLTGSNCTRPQLAAMALRLGADVPFFVHNDMSAAWATGIGEQLEPAIGLKGFRVLLVNPGINVSTKWVFETFALTATKKNDILSGSQKEKTDTIDMDFCSQPFHPDDLYNDLERVTAEQFKIIKSIRLEMLTAGADGAMMSGSGATVFGLFSQQRSPQAEQCYQAFKNKYNQVYLVDSLS